MGLEGTFYRSSNILEWVTSKLGFRDATQEKVKKYVDFGTVIHTVQHLQSD